MVFKNHGSAVHNGQDCSSGYEFSENLLKNIAIQVKSSNFRKGKDWKAVMGGLPILITIEDEAFRRRVLSGEKELKKTMFRLRMRSWFEPLNRTRLSIIIMPSM